MDDVRLTLEVKRGLEERQEHLCARDGGGGVDGRGGATDLDQQVVALFADHLPGGTLRKRVLAGSRGYAQAHPLAKLRLVEYSRSLHRSHATELASCPTRFQAVGATQLDDRDQPTVGATRHGQRLGVQSPLVEEEQQTSHCSEFLAQRDQERVPHASPSLFRDDLGRPRRVGAFVVLAL
jgi:hypothetical protein